MILSISVVALSVNAYSLFFNTKLTMNIATITNILGVISLLGLKSFGYI